MRVTPRTAGDPDVTTEDIERTIRDIAVAQWGVASVVMLGSAAAAGVAFNYLGEPWGLGVVTALAVDLALATWLRIGGRLRAIGVRSTAGFVLEVITIGMTLFLNVGSAVFKGINQQGTTAHNLLGFAHTFLPVVLLLVTIAGSDAQLKLLRLRRQRAVDEQAELVAKLAADRAAHETDQQRLTAQRDAEGRARELAAGEHEQEMTDRREAREHADRDLIIGLGSVLSLGATLRSRPKRPARRPTAASHPRPTNPAPAAAVRPTPVPVTDALLSQARELRARQLSQGKTAGRAVLQRELGVPERTAKELVKRLDEQPLHIVTGGKS